MTQFVIFATMPQFTIQNDPFYNELKLRVNAYLGQEGRSRYAGPKMWRKTAILLLFFVALSAALCSGKFSGWMFIVIQALWLFSQFLMTIGIVHDAAHNCYTRSRKTNRRMMYLFDFMGIHSGHWIENHVDSHHSGPNIPFHDSAIESFSLIRLHPKAPGGPLSRYQHFYMFFVYSVATVFQVYFLEFLSLAQGLVGFKRIDPKQVLFILCQKIFVLGYSLLLPLFFLRNPASEIFAGWLLGHLACGLALGVIFMTTHLHQDTEFVDLTPEGRIPGSFAAHILRTTADVGADNAFYTWLSGGLNLHVAHHLFPTISQIHLPAMTRIVRETAREFGIPYYEYSLLNALKSHLTLLKKLGALPKEAQ